MSEYNVGNALLQITPSFKGVAESINAQAEKWGVSSGQKYGSRFSDAATLAMKGMRLGPSDSDSTRQGSKSGGKFADGFRAKVTAALKALPDIEVNADTSDADFKLAELRQQLLELSSKTVGVDIDEATARAEIDRIKAELDELGRESPSVRVQADTAAASAKLAELQAQIAAVGSEDAEVNVDDGGSISAAEGGLFGLSSLLIGLVPLAAPVGAALAAAFAGVATVGGTLAATAGVAVLGVSGVTKAVQLLNQRATATGPALAKINAQLAALNPVTLQFARYVQGTLGPALDKLKGAAAAGLLPGVEAGLNAMLPLLPSLTKFVGSLAKTMGDLFTQAGKALTSPFWQQFFAYITATAGPTLTTFAKIVGNIAQGLAGLLEAFGPVVAGMGRALLGASRSFADFASGSSALTSFMGYVKQYAPAVADAIGKIATIIGKLVVALAPLGGAMVQAIDGIVSALARLSPTQLLAVAAAVGALLFEFGSGQAVAIGLALAVTAAAGLIAANWSKVQPVVQPVLDLFSEIWRFIQDKLVPVLKGILSDALAGIASAFHTVSAAVRGHEDQLNQLKTAFAAIATFIVTKVMPLFGPLIKLGWQASGQAIRVLIDIISGLIEGLDGMITTGKKVGKWFSGPFVKFFDKVGSGIKTALSSVAGAAVDAWNGVQNAFATGINFVTQDILNPFIRAINSVLGVFGVHIGTIGRINVNTSNDNGPGSRGGGQNAPRAYALGGVAPGYSPGNDTLLARVSPGEGFIVPEAVRGLGGPPAIHAINAMFSSRVPGFSLGGVIGGIGSAVGGVVSTVVGKARQAAAAVALKALEALEVPIRAALAFAPSGFAQLLGGGMLDNVNSHVHDYIEGKAYDNGGYLPPGLTAVWNGTGAPEPVFTPRQLAQLAAGGIGDVTVHVAIGNEAIDPRMVRITNVTFDNRLTGAKHVAPAGAMPALNALDSAHARGASR